MTIICSWFSSPVLLSVTGGATTVVSVPLVGVTCGSVGRRVTGGGTPAILSSIHQDLLYWFRW